MAQSNFYNGLDGNRIRWPLLIGLILMETDILEMDMLTQALNALSRLGRLIFGLGRGLAVSPKTGLALSQVPNHLAGVGAAALNAARQVGSLMGVAVLDSVSAAVGSGNPLVPCVSAALVCWIGAVGIWRVIPLISGFGIPATKCELEIQTVIVNRSGNALLQA